MSGLSDSDQQQLEAQRAVLKQAANILAGLGQSDLAQAVSNALEPCRVPTLSPLALPPTTNTDLTPRNVPSCPSNTWQNAGFESVTLASSSSPSLLDDAGFQIDDIFDFGGTLPAEAAPWDWEGLEILGTGVLPQLSVPASDNYELLSDPWPLETAPNGGPQPQFRGGYTGPEDAPGLPAQMQSVGQLNQHPKPVLVRRTKELLPVPSLGCNADAAPAMPWPAPSSVSDQFERARSHRKLVKKGPGSHAVVKRRPFTDHVKKQQTAVTRQNKACIRCHLQRIRCFPSEEDPQGVCLTCQLSKPTFCRLPCIRYKITDVPLFRLGATDDFVWSKRWLGKALKDISHWASADTRSVILTQDYGETSIEVPVKKFIPISGDVLDYFWMTGPSQRRTFECPPFAIANLEQVSLEVKRHVKQSAAQHIAAFTLDRTAVLGKTFSMVMQSAERSKDKATQKLLNEVIELWVASRLIEKPWRVKGDETLGHVLSDEHPFFDPQSPYFNRIPVTPVMDTQIDQIVIKTILLPLKRSVQRGLRTLVEANKPEHWFTIYLCVFVLLSNYEIATQHDRSFAIRYSLETRFSNYPLLEGFHTGAKTMLAHFHYCNKGGTPFRLDWSNPPAVEWADLSGEQVAYMKDVIDTIHQEGQDFKTLKQSRAYEVDGHLISQLFDGEWQSEYML